MTARTEYEFELYGQKFLARTDSRGRVHSYERADDDSGWVGLDFGPNPFADETLRLRSIIDEWERLGLELAKGPGVPDLLPRLQRLMAHRESP